jgi:hypothetical protein
MPSNMSLGKNKYRWKIKLPMGFLLVFHSESIEKKRLVVFRRAAAMFMKIHEGYPWKTCM